MMQPGTKWVGLGWTQPQRRQVAKTCARSDGVNKTTFERKPQTRVRASVKWRQVLQRRMVIGLACRWRGKACWWRSVGFCTTSLRRKVTAIGLWCRTVAVAEPGSNTDARHVARMDPSEALDTFIAVVDVQKWRVIALRASPPSERPDSLPADFIGIIHENVDNP